MFIVSSLVGRVAQWLSRQVCKPIVKGFDMRPSHGMLQWPRGSIDVLLFILLYPSGKWVSCYDNSIPCQSVREVRCFLTAALLIWRYIDLPCAVKKILLIWALWEGGLYKCTCLIWLFFTFYTIKSNQGKPIVSLDTKNKDFFHKKALPILMIYCKRSLLLLLLFLV